MKVPTAKKLPSGNYFIQLRFKDEEPVYITAASEPECIKQAEYIKAAHRAGARKKRLNPVGDMTVGDAVNAVIAARTTARRLDARSVQQYEDIKRLRFQDIVDTKLSALTPELWNKAIEDELNKPSRKGGKLSIKTVKDAHALFSAAINKYMPDFDTSYEFPETQRKLYDLLPPDKIWDAVYGTDIELTALLAMWLSLTASEIRGITKSKSIKGDMLYITETVVQINGEAIRRERAKESDRIRVLQIPPYLMELINAVEGDEIETRTPHAIYMRFNKVLEQHGLPRMKFHDLRKVNASMQITLDIPETVTLQRNGWSTRDMLDKVYAQTFTGQRQEADKKIDDHMTGILNDIKKRRSGIIYETVLPTKNLILQTKMQMK